MSKFYPLFYYGTNYCIRLFYKKVIFFVKFFINSIVKQPHTKSLS